MKLMLLEGNCRLVFDQALQIDHVLDELGWSWLEEPIAKQNIDGYTRLNSELKIPITGGESYTTLDPFEPFFAKKAYSIAQCDVDVDVCGLTEATRIVRRAYSEGIE